MAYNISVLTQTPEERWQWVQAGIRLLRDEWIPANPNNMLLHKELAWIYLHKIQGYTDDANNYYKRRLAEQWTIVLGEPPQGLSFAPRMKAIEAYATWLERVADAPDRLDEVIQSEPSVAELVDRIKSEVGEEPGLDLLRRYTNQQSLVRSGQRDLFMPQMGPKSAAMRRLLDDPKYTKAWDALVLYMRKRALIDEFHMEPWRMVRYTRKYGPIDWRHPAAHSLYWAARGVEEALGRYEEQNQKDFDFLNTDRIVVQSIQELWRSGELYFSYFDFIARRDPTRSYFAMPNPHFVAAYGEILDEMVARGGIFEDVEKRVYRPLAAGYENFMKDAIRFFYRRGQTKLAEQYYEQIGTWEGQNLNDPQRKYKFSLPLDEFVQEELKDRQISPSVAIEEVTAALQSAYFSGLLAGNMDRFNTQFRYAKLSHRYFMENQFRNTPAGGAVARMEQMNRDFRVYSGQVLGVILSSVGLGDAVTMYNNAPPDLQGFVYDMLKQTLGPGLDATKKQGGKGFDDLFPEPPGIEQIRAELQQAAREAQQRGQVAAPK